MTQKALVGVSSCLLGEEVRYNGLHKLDSFVAGGLAELVELRPVCPEVDIGLGVPRAPLPPPQQVGDARVVGQRRLGAGDAGGEQGGCLPAGSSG